MQIIAVTQLTLKDSARCSNLINCLSPFLKYFFKTNLTKSIFFFFLKILFLIWLDLDPFFVCGWISQVLHVNLGSRMRGFLQIPVSTAAARPAVNRELRTPPRSETWGAWALISELSTDEHFGATKQSPAHMGVCRKGWEVDGFLDLAPFHLNLLWFLIFSKSPHCACDFC